MQVSGQQHSQIHGSTYLLEIPRGVFFGVELTGWNGMTSSDVQVVYGAHTLSSWFSAGIYIFKALAGSPSR